MKGIILAGGSGTRLYPITKGISKQLMPIYDKPMIYYPLSTLMLAGISDILIITTPEDNSQFKRLLGDGSVIGCNISYAVQEVPNGLAQAFVIGEDFIGNDNVALVLGDNIFYRSGIEELLVDCKNPSGGIVFAYRVNNPKLYGVVDFDEDFNALSIEEKPENPKSDYAVPGLYFYENSVIDVAKGLKPSSRGEYEITDINKYYLEKGELKVKVFDRGTAWLDTGNFESLHDATDFVRVIEKRQGYKVGCIEEIAYRNGLINKQQLLSIANENEKSGYGKYLKKILNE